MEIEVIGSYGGETPECRLTCLLVNGTTAIDAGCLCRGLEIERQLGSGFDRFIFRLTQRKWVKRLGVGPFKNLGKRWLKQPLAGRVVPGGEIIPQSSPASTEPA